MNAGAGDLTAGEQASHIGFTTGSGPHAAHRVVGRGCNRQRFAREVQAMFTTGLVDMREACADELRGQVREVEEDVVCAGVRHLLLDGTRHHIARRQFCPPVVVRHESAARPVPQHSAFPTRRLRYQQRWDARQAQGSGMELDELQVHQFGSRVKGEGDAVAGRDVGVGRVAVEPAGAAGREHQRGCVDTLGCAALAVQYISARHPAAAGNDAGHQPVLAHLDP